MNLHWAHDCAALCAHSHRGAELRDQGAGAADWRAELKSQTQSILPLVVCFFVNVPVAEDSSGDEALSGGRGHKNLSS
jgi:hypothetical protein